MSSVRLVLFHGLASTPKEFGLLLAPLKRSGITVLSPQLPRYSHADAAAAPESAVGGRVWQGWVDEAADYVDALARESDEPIVLGGLCTGAMLAIAVAARSTRANLQGLALLSPLFAYDGWGLPWWYRLRYVAYAVGAAGLFSMKERAPYGLKNERMRAMVRQQLSSAQPSMVGPNAVPLTTVRESERLSRHARGVLPTLRLPIMVMHARDDEICSLASVRRVMSSVSATAQVSMHVLDNSFHMLPIDNDRFEVARRLASFAAAPNAAERSAAVPAPFTVSGFNGAVTT